VVRKLPIWKTVTKSYGGAMSTLAGLRWYSLFAFLAILGFSEVQAFWNLVLMHGLMAGKIGPGNAMKVISTVIGPAFVGTILVTPYLIEIHQEVLIREREKTNYFSRFAEKRTWVFAIWATVIYFTVFHLPRGVVAASTQSLIQLPIVTVIGSILFVVGPILIVRFFLVFPGIAIGARRINFSYSWKITKGNTWRLIIIFVIAFLPFGVIVFVIVGFRRLLGDSLAGQLSLDVVSAVIAMLAGLLMARVLSLTLKDRVNALRAKQNARA